MTYCNHFQGAAHFPEISDIRVAPAQQGRLLFGA